ncbi:MAG: AtpZ/AtpI family protein [Actinobacteria bacterium]|nr:AtpZ/AtpI family protein [Actinomycetota bacterium]
MVLRFTSLVSRTLRSSTKVSSVPAQPDSLSRGMEIAGTALVFFVLGWFIDRRVETTPLFMIVFVVVALVAQFVKLYYVYNAQMSQLEAERRETARAR